jgi:hypothetical protein
MPPESDSALVKQGYVSITALTGVEVARDVDLSATLGAVPGAGRAGAPVAPRASDASDASGAPAAPGAAPGSA